MLTAPEMTQAEQEVLEELSQRQGVVSPNELVDRLAHKGVRSDLARRAIWRLADRRQITVTHTWKLKSRAVE